MKDKIMFLIIGILIGAIVATAGFLIYNSTKSSNMDEPGMMQMDEGGFKNGGRPDEDNGEEVPTNPDGEDGEEPPAKPDGDEGEVPPSSPEESDDNANI